MSLKAILTICILSLQVSVSVFAGEFDSCRCAKGLATIGDTKVEVLQECGKPMLKQRVYKSVRGTRRYVEEWIYNFGPNEFMQAVNFDRYGKVISVDSLDYGS